MFTRPNQFETISKLVFSLIIFFPSLKKVSLEEIVSVTTIIVILNKRKKEGNKSSRPEMYDKIGDLKIFAKFAAKLLVPESLIYQSFRPSV